MLVHSSLQLRGALAEKLFLSADAFGAIIRSGCHGVLYGFDGYWFDVALALAAGKELSILCVSAGQATNPVRERGFAIAPCNHPEVREPVSRHESVPVVLFESSPICPKTLLFFGKLDIARIQRENGHVMPHDRHRLARVSKGDQETALQLRRIAKSRVTADHSFEHALGMSPAALAEHAEAAARIPAALQAIGEPQPVFDFILGPSSRGPVKSRENQTVRGRRRQT